MVKNFDKYRVEDAKPALIIQQSTLYFAGVSYNCHEADLAAIPFTPVHGWAARMSERTAHAQDRQSL